MAQEAKKIKKAILLEINIVISKERNTPIIELRKKTNDSDLIRTIIHHALTGQPISFLPTFRNKLQSINSLIEKGIINFDTEKNTITYNL